MKLGIIDWAHIRELDLKSKADDRYLEFFADKAVDNDHIEAGIDLELAKLYCDARRDKAFKLGKELEAAIEDFYQAADVVDMAAKVTARWSNP